MRSRSLATAFIRLAMFSPASSGITSVYTVRLAATAASSIVMKRTSWSFAIRKSTIPAPSEVEIDHFLHHHDADRHPDDAADQHELAYRVDPQQRDVVGRGEIDQDHHDRRQCADDAGGSLGFLRHRLDLLGHLLAVAQHLGEVAERFGEVAAALLLNRDHDAEEV